MLDLRDGNNDISEMSALRKFQENENSHVMSENREQASFTPGEQASFMYRIAVRLLVCTVCLNCCEMH